MTSQNRLDRRESRFEESLEARARALLQKAVEDDGISPLRGIREELALTLAHMDRLWSTHSRQLESLLRVECYVDTELIWMEQRTPRYSSYRFRERFKLQRRLDALEAERRRLPSSLEDNLRPLRERLLSLLTKLRYLQPAR